MSDWSSATSADNRSATSAVGLKTNLSPHRENNVRVTEWIHGEERGLHLSHAFIHLGTPGELFHMAGRQFEHTNITLLGRDSSLDNIDITLGRDSLRLDLLD
jgi:hypothetical protein